MKTFAVGKVAIGQNFRNWPELNGMCCEIIGGLRPGFGHDSRTGETRKGQFYLVRWADCTELWVMPEYLRKRRPPSTDESESHQAMLDCIERAKQPLGVEA